MASRCASTSRPGENIADRRLTRFPTRRFSISSTLIQLLILVENQLSVDTDPSSGCSLDATRARIWQRAPRLLLLLYSAQGRHLAGLLYRTSALRQFKNGVRGHEYQHRSVQWTCATASSRKARNARDKMTKPRLPLCH